MKRTEPKAPSTWPRRLAGSTAGFVAFLFVGALSLVAYPVGLACGAAARFLDLVTERAARGLARLPDPARPLGTTKARRVRDTKGRP